MTYLDLSKPISRMQIPIYQVDAFTSQPFAGNPAAVCVLESWLDDAVMQNIAAENNLSETAFIVCSEKGYDLRWFTPNMEVDLCGHATLASAYVVFEYLQPTWERVNFYTTSGQLAVDKTDKGLLSMDFPTTEGVHIDVLPIVEQALGVTPQDVRLSRDLLVVLESEQQVMELQPDFEKIKQIPDALGVIVTAAGQQTDFVSRFFAPLAGVPEDPVTGSAHCTLIPYWAKRLGKNSLHARQGLLRGGELFCEYQGKRVLISGFAALYLAGQISI